MVRIENEIHALKATNSYKILSDDEKNELQIRIKRLQRSLENFVYYKALSDSIVFGKCLKTIKNLKNIKQQENRKKVNKIKAYSIKLPYCGVGISFYNKDSIYKSMDASGNISYYTYEQIDSLFKSQQGKEETIFNHKKRTKNEFIEVDPRNG